MFEIRTVLLKYAQMERPAHVVISRRRQNRWTNVWGQFLCLTGCRGRQKCTVTRSIYTGCTANSSTRLGNESNQARATRHFSLPETTARSWKVGCMLLWTQTLICGVPGKTPTHWLRVKLGSSNLSHGTGSASTRCTAKFKTHQQLFSGITTKFCIRQISLPYSTYIRTWPYSCKRVKSGKLDIAADGLMSLVWVNMPTSSQTCVWHNGS